MTVNPLIGVSLEDTGGDKAAECICDVEGLDTEIKNNSYNSMTSQHHLVSANNAIGVII